MILRRGLPRPPGVFPEDPPRFAGTVRRCRLHGAYMAAAGGVFAPAPVLTGGGGFATIGAKALRAAVTAAPADSHGEQKQSRGSAALCGGCG